MDQHVLRTLGRRSYYLTFALYETCMRLDTHETLVNSGNMSFFKRNPYKLLISLLLTLLVFLPAFMPTLLPSSFANYECRSKSFFTQICTIIDFVYWIYAFMFYFALLFLYPFNSYGQFG